MYYVMVVVFLISSGGDGYVGKIPTSQIIPFQTLDACVASAKTIVNDSNDMAYCVDQSTGFTTGRIIKG